MEKLLKTIEEKKLKLDSLRPLPKELVKNLDEWFRVEQTYNSNAIEGNTLTLQETALVVEKGLTVSGKPLKDHLEAKNLAFAIDYVKSLVKTKRQDLKIKDILNIHSMVLKGIDDEHSGCFRNVLVRISGSNVTLPDPLKVPELMEEFITWLHESKDNPVKVAADAHFKLVRIHPFVDGNGRTARLLMDLLLMQAGYPPAIIQVKDKIEYINALEKADTGNFDDYYNVIFNALEKSLDIYLDMASKTIG